MDERIFTTRQKNKAAANTDGAMGNCLQQPGQFDNQHQKSMRLSLISLIKFCLP